MFAVFYVYLMLTRNLLGGHSVYFHFVYSLIGELLALGGLFTGIRSRGAMKRPIIAISCVMVLAFCDSLGLIPYPEAPLYFAMFVCLALAQIIHTVKFRVAANSMT